MTKIEKKIEALERSLKEKEKEFHELKEQVLQERVTLALREHVMPLLGDIKNKLSLIVSYEPGKDISVQVNRVNEVVEDAENPSCFGQETQEQVAKEETAMENAQTAPAIGGMDTGKEQTANVENLSLRERFELFLKKKLKPGIFLNFKSCIDNAEVLRVIGLITGKSSMFEVSEFKDAKRAAGSTKHDNSIERSLLTHYAEFLQQEFVAAAKRAAKQGEEVILIDEKDLSEAEGRKVRVTIKKDGKTFVFFGREFKQSFIDVLKFIGLEDVAKINIPANKGKKYNLVDTRKREDGHRKWQEQEGKFWIYIYTSNSVKSDQLLKIKKYHNLDMTIEAIGEKKERKGKKKNNSATK